jgi:hypothetical protein
MRFDKVDLSIEPNVPVWRGLMQQNVMFLLLLEFELNLAVAGCQVYCEGCGRAECAHIPHNKLIKRQLDVGLISPFGPRKARPKGRKIVPLAERVERAE